MGWPSLPKKITWNCHCIILENMWHPEYASSGNWSSHVASDSSYSANTLLHLGWTGSQVLLVSQDHHQAVQLQRRWEESHNCVNSAAYGRQTLPSSLLSWHIRHIHASRPMTKLYRFYLVWIFNPVLSTSRPFLGTEKVLNNLTTAKWMNKWHITVSWQNITPSTITTIFFQSYERCVAL